MKDLTNSDNIIENFNEKSDNREACKSEIIIPFKSTIRIERERYEDLVRKETLLSVVIKAVSHVHYSSDLEEIIKWLLFEEDRAAEKDDGEDK